MEKSYSEIPVVSLRNQFGKINSKFPGLILESNYKIQVGTRELHLQMYSLNKEYANWKKVLDSNPIILKNLRMQSVYMADIDKHHNPLLSTFPAYIEYESHVFSDMNRKLTNNKHLLCYSHYILDSKYLFISYSSYLNAWIFLYDSKEIILMSRKGLIASTKEGLSQTLKTITKIWSQKLAEWKINKLLNNIEQEFGSKGYSLVFECTGNSSIFIIKEQYRLITILLNITGKDSERVFPMISHNEVKRISEQLKISNVKISMNEINSKEILSKLIEEQSLKKNIKSVLHVIEEDNKVIGISLNNTIDYTMCYNIRKIILSYITNNIPLYKIKAVSIESVLKPVNEYYKNLASAFIDLLDEELMDVKLFKEAFPKILNLAIENLSKPKGNYIIVFTADDKIDNKFIKFEGLDFLVGEEGKIYYSSVLPKYNILNEYLKSHSCKVLICGFKSEETKEIEEHCLNGSITITPTSHHDIAFNFIQGTIDKKSLTSVEVEEEKVIKVKEEINKPKDKHVLLIVFLGIPGIGKSHFIEQLKKIKEPKYDLSVISSDEIKKQLIDNYILKHPEDNYETAFQKTLKITKQVFNEKLSTFFSHHRTLPQ